MSFLSANFEKFSAHIGSILIPLIMDVIGFFKQFGNEIVIIGGTILALVVAFKTYETVMNAFKAAQILYIAVTRGMEAAQIALTFATEGGEVATKSMAVAQGILNAVMEANPIMLVVTALLALAAVFVVAWNHSQTFRNAVIDVAKAGVQAFGWLIGVIGDLVVAWMKVITGPMKLMLEGLSHLPIVGGAAKAALKDIGTATKDVGNFFDGTKKKIDGYGASLDSLKKKKIQIPGLGSSTTSKIGSLDETSPYALQNYTGSVKSKTPKTKTTKTKSASISSQEHGVINFTVNYDGTKVATQKSLYGGK
jgi:hypothetical protein